MQNLHVKLGTRNFLNSKITLFCLHLFIVACYTLRAAGALVQKTLSQKSSLKICFDKMTVVQKKHSLGYRIKKVTLGRKTPWGVQGPAGLGDESPDCGEG